MGLIEVDDNGNWKLKGVRWSQIKPGAVITVQVWAKLYAALCKLKDYEETGLMPDGVKKLNEETQEQARAMPERVAKLPDEIEKMKRDERQQWIPVTERFPEPGDYVLLSFPDFSVPAIGRYDEDEEGGAFFIGDETESLVSQDMFVNAWMPLPETYAEVN